MHSIVALLFVTATVFFAQAPVLAFCGCEHAGAGRDPKPRLASALASPVTIPAGRLTCASLAVTVKTTIEKLPGVKSPRASHRGHQAIVTCDHTKAKPEQVAQAINQPGYEAGVPEKSS